MVPHNLRVLGASNHSETEREVNNFYSTNPIAVQELLKREKNHFIGKDILEPCCGYLAISDEILMLLGDEINSLTNSDLINRGCEDIVGDYLKLDFKNQCDIVITNPPYDRKGTHIDIILKAIDDVRDGGRVYMFLKTLFLETQNRYDKLFKNTPPSKVYVFSDRIDCYKGGEKEDKPDSGAISYSWFVWEKNFTGKPVIDWIRFKK